MKQLIYTGLLILLSFQILAQQEFAPLGAQWTYDFHNSQEAGYQTLSVIGDTTIQDSICKIIHWEQFYKKWNDSSSEEPFYRSKGHRYIHQKGDSIFQFDPNQARFLFLFPLTLSDSGTFNSPYSSYHPFYPTIPEGLFFSFSTIDHDSIVINIDNSIKTLRRTKFYSSCNITGVGSENPKFIIESIGPTFFLFINEIECYWREYIFNWQLRCYQDNRQTILFNDKPCDIITSSSSRTDSDYNIYPNPTSSDLYITPSTSIKYLIIYNSNGSVLRKAKNPIFPINVTLLEKGIYFLQLISEKEEKIYTTHFIKN